MKRDASDRPAARSFRVDALVRHRYAATAVRTEVHNPSALAEQTFRFGFAMPERALVRNESMAIVL